MKILQASMAASFCARYLAMAAADDLADRMPGWKLESAIKELQNMAESLGYQLVKVPTAPSITTILPLNSDEESHAGG